MPQKSQWPSGFRDVSTAAGEVVELSASPVWLGLGTPLGYGRPVVLIPGLGASDASLVVLARWLGLRGYRTHRARLGINIACSEHACGRLEARLERLFAGAGQRVAVVGHSRGGVLAKAIASARPDLVAGIVTLGSPTGASSRVVQRPVANAVSATVRQGHLPNPLSWRCLCGRCDRRFGRALTGAFPNNVGYVSVCSANDPLVPPRLCRHPSARVVEVRSSHLGMAHNAAVFTEVGKALGGFAVRRRRPGLAHAARQARAVSRALVLV